MPLRKPISPSLSSSFLPRPQILNATMNNPASKMAPPTPTTTPMTVLRVFVDIPLVASLVEPREAPEVLLDLADVVVELTKVVYEVVLPLDVSTTVTSDADSVVAGAVDVMRLVVWSAVDVVAVIEGELVVWATDADVLGVVGVTEASVADVVVASDVVVVASVVEVEDGDVVESDVEVVSTVTLVSVSVEVPVVDAVLSPVVESTADVTLVTGSLSLSFGDAILLSKSLRPRNASSHEASAIATRTTNKATNRNMR
jgi:hypothetical protein